LQKKCYLCSIMRNIFSFLLSVILLTACHAEKNLCKDCDYTVKVVAITDGDTFKGLRADKTLITCRMYGIDAPEKKQSFGNRSKQYLSDLIFDKMVSIKSHGQDRNKRYIVQVYTAKGKDVSAEMLKAGMAWHYKQYDKSALYDKLEKDARRKNVGLWQEKSPTPPWQYRKTKH